MTTREDRKTVLVTGASGYVASQMLPEFSRRYELRLVDVTDHDRDGNLVEGVEVVDLIDPERDHYRHLFEGVDAVVHLGYKHSRDGGADGEDMPQLERFPVELENVQMANNVYRTAFDAGVSRVVMASSNHAADWYEYTLVHSSEKDMVFPDELPLSNNFYGWSKGAYELLGWVYACGAFGRKLEVVQVRIGAPRDTSGKHYDAGLDTLIEKQAEPQGPGMTSNLGLFKRDLGAHFSERDLTQLFRRAVDTDNIEDSHGIPWLVVYGISGNTRAFWSLENARRVLGYQPEDDSEVKYAADVQRLLTGHDANARKGRVGG